MSNYLYRPFCSKSAISPMWRKLSRHMASKSYDLVVIGSGPGGYVAAIKAAQLGMKTACVERSPSLGGTCLNIGCIPSKALLHCSHQYHQLASGAASKLGVTLQGLDFDLGKMMAHKNNVVSTLTGGIAALFKYNKIAHINGFASFTSPTEISVTRGDGSAEILSTKNTLIATGSDVTSFPGIEIDEKSIVSSTGALSLQRVPERLVVIGAGVIGLELGSVWRRLGSQVTCLEFMQNVGGNTIDGEVSKALLSLLKKEGIKFLLGHKVLGASQRNGEIAVSYVDVASGNEGSVECDVLLVCVGRKPFTEGLGLEKIGVRVDEKGRIHINNKFETSAKGVYAIGDCVPGPMLAHKAEEEGVACIEGICGKEVHLNYNAIPSVIYTHPEVAWVGSSEDQLKDQRVKYKVGKFPLSNNGRSRAAGEIDGFAKVLTDADNDKLLGAHFISPIAGEVINQMSMAIEYGASAEDVARVCHAHPTVAECLKEACHAAAFGKPINGV